MGTVGGAAAVGMGDELGEIEPGRQADLCLLNLDSPAYVPLNDPVQNIMAGAKYLRYLTDRFGGDQQKAIAAYNAGEGAVRRFGGVPPYRETRNYVLRVRSFQQDLGSQLQNQVADVQVANPGL